MKWWHAVYHLLRAIELIAAAYMLILAFYALAHGEYDRATALFAGSFMLSWQKPREVNPWDRTKP